MVAPIAIPATNQTTLSPPFESDINPPSPFYAARHSWYPHMHMASADLVTVYRSMDANAKEDCETIAEILSDRNISAIIVDDSAPGVPEGIYEVRVPAADSARAEAIIAENPLPDEVEEVDDSEDLDLETVFHSDDTIPEVEAMGVKSVLE